MEALELKYRRKQIQSAVVYTLTSLVIISYGWFYLADQYTLLFQMGDEISNTYTKLNETQKSGLSPDDLRTVLNRVVKNTDTVNAFYADKNKLADAIKKPEDVTLDYNDWLLSEAGKKSQFDEEISHNNDVIGNIIPILAPKDVNDLDISSLNNLITLKTFIDYVEVNLLRKYHLESYSSLGFGNIEFEKNASKITSDIGSFKVSLQIKGINSDIKSLLNAIQSSGKLILKDGKLVSPVEIQDDGKFSGLSNLLITIDDVKLTQSLNSDDSASNDGSIDLRFYVRNLGSQELIALRSRLANQYAELNKNIALYSDCKKLGKIGDIVCSDTDGSRSIGAIKSLQRDLEALKTQFDSIKSGSSDKDPSSDLENAFNFSASLQAIDKIFQENLAVINKLTKTGAK